MRQRSPLSEAGNRDIDDIWLEGADVFVSDLPLVQRARSKVLQYNISAAGELAEDILSTRMMEVERNRFLVAVNAEERGASVLSRRIRHTWTKLAAHIASV